jgi:hypothetical protein
VSLGFCLSTDVSVVVVYDFVGLESGEGEGMRRGMCFLFAPQGGWRACSEDECGDGVWLAG